MTTYEVVYFNAKGRAETCRFLFAQAGVEYKDTRVNKEEWAKLKPSTATGALPMLVVDGKQLPGSGPMARFLAERFGLGGDNDIEGAEIAGIIDVLEDCMKKFSALFYEQDEEKKAIIVEDLKKNTIPKYFDILEKIIQSNDANGFIYGKKGPTYADFSIYNMIGFVEAKMPGIFVSYPGINKLKAAVASLPNIAKWLKERPTTEN